MVLSSRDGHSRSISFLSAGGGKKQVLIFQFYYSTGLFFLVHKLHGRGLPLSKQLPWDGIL